MSSSLIVVRQQVWRCIWNSRSSSQSQLWSVVWQNRQFLRRCGSNIARAEIFDEKPLYELLQEGVIAGYASDVWFHEAKKNDRKQKVAPSDYLFSDLKNVVMTPHCATHTCDAQSRYISDCVNACISYIKVINQ